MAKAELKSAENDSSVEEFLSKAPKTQQEDSQIILKMMQEATGASPKMWGPSLVGFGKIQLHYASGRELDWFEVGFSPRKANLSLYVLRGGEAPYKNLLAKLGKHKLGKGCLYINKLSDVDLKVLNDIINKSVKTDFYTGKPL